MTTHNRPNYQNTSFASTFSRHSKIPSHESLIGDFVCMLSNTKLVPGHLYCRKNSLAFYANAMRDDTKILLSFDDVIRIKKPNHQTYLDNAIEIVCKDNKNYTFVQFPNREAAYALLIRVFRAFIKTSKEIRDSKSNSPSQILGQASLRHLFSGEKGHSGYSSPKSETKSEESNDPSLSNSPNVTQYLTEEQQQRDEEGFYQTIETVLPVSVDQAFDLYFGDHPVFPYGEHLAHLGAYNVKVGKWKMNEQRHRNERRIHCNKALHGIFYDTEMGSKSIQSYREGEDGTITVAIKTKLLNVPYAESYYLKERFILSPAEGSENHCQITGFVNAIFTGDCCMKDMLEERVHEDKKKEHELWVQYINQNKLFGRKTTELILEKIRELHSRQHPAENSQAEEDPKSLVIDPKDIAHGDGDTLIENLKLPATPSPSIDPDFLNGSDKPDVEGRTCVEILENKTTKSQIKPIILAESLEAIDEKQLVEKEDAGQKEQDIQLKSKKEEQEDSNKDSKVLKSPKNNESTEKEKPMNLSSLSEVDQQSGSIANTGIFDSPVQSTQKGLKDIQHKIGETNIAKKLGNEMEKVKDFKAKVEEKIVSSKPVLSQHEHHLSTSLAQARRMTRILFMLVIVLFFMFVGTTLHLSSKLSNLQSSCNMSSV